MKTLLLLTLTFLSLNSIASKCSHIKSDCMYYSCIEEEKRCGSRGYIQGFGEKYCKKFFYKEYLFSEKGKLWINEVMSCLIHRMDSFDDALTCKEFKREAVKAHVPCYVEAGYCNLSNKDQLLITKIISKSLWRPSLIISGLKVLRACH